MLFKWGLATLLQEDSWADLVPAEVRGEWSDLLARLVPFPVDQRGFKVSGPVSFDKSHRHFSHLFALWPLKLAEAYDGPEAVALSLRSLDNWLSMPSGLTGFARYV